MSASPAAPRFLPDDKALACIHCGLCLSACPTYLETGNENNSPRGRILLMRALDDGTLPLNDGTVRPLDLCLGCRACEVACPSGVEYGHLLESTRAHIHATHRRSPWQRVLRGLLIDRVLPIPSRMRVALAPAALVRRLGITSWVPRALRAPLDLLPASSEAAVPLAEMTAHTAETRRGTVGFIRGCVMGVLFSRTNAASVSLLSAAGFDVVAPRAQGCCGALYAHSGNLEAARHAARHNIAVFERHEVAQIVINAAGCGSTLKEYGHLLADDPEWAARAHAFSAKVRDLSECLVTAGFADQLQSRRDVRAREAHDETEAEAGRPRVTFHDACHLAHAQRVTSAPRQLVRALAGDRFVELPEADVCCGSAGSYNLTEPEMAARLQARKVAHIRATGADVVVSTNPGCLMQIEAGLRAGQRPVRVVHLADYLAEA
jgi:glycolate oxidase iron-sulfur subunit